MVDEDVARDADDVFLDEGVPVNQEIDAVRRQELLQFQPVDAGSVAFLDVQENVVVVDDVPNLHPERLGVAKRAKRDAVHRDKRQDGIASVGVQDGVQPLQIEDELVPVRHAVQAIDPQRVLIVPVEDGHAALEAQQVVVRYRNLNRTAVCIQVHLQRRRDREGHLLFRYELVVHSIKNSCSWSLFGQHFRED